MQVYSTFGEQRRRRRREFWWRSLRLALFIGVIAAAASYAYQVGVAQNTTEVERLRGDIESLLASNQELQERAGAAMQLARQAKQRADELAERYAAEVPRGDLRLLLDLIEGKLSEGVPAERIGFVVSAVTRERECDPNTETKRFLVRTPVGTGPVSAVSFADDRITVTGIGEPARNEEGEREAWFDSSKEVSLRFLKLDGEMLTAEGRLPLAHAMVLDGREYRFLAKSAPEQGFVEITGQSCAYP
ncbi:MAG: hypothetical protein ACFB3T_14740 [Geminicoccaceae bacterium]